MPNASGGRIRVGIGGWTFPPWRGAFYPQALPHTRELDYASRHVTSIEINGTYYRLQRPESFARWREETPDDFVFALKAPRYVTNRRVLAEAGKSMQRFLDSGLVELQHKLGPINWQFLPTKQYDAADFEAFLKLLPAEVQGHPLRHVVEVRHPSFAHPDFIALLRAHGIGLVVADSADYPALHDPTAPFIYARLQSASEQEAAGYPDTALERWAERAHAWATGRTPEDLPLLAPTPRKASQGRDVFIYMINGFKPKAPAAAMALLDRLSRKRG
ncbi:MAG TPA: DUF72 domain-containing protein [Acetobacteraceae bacterium]|nr:DUF72 domain-containing protein [Acetobacteraceae bacterium]